MFYNISIFFSLAFHFLFSLLFPMFRNFYPAFSEQYVSITQPLWIKFKFICACYTDKHESLLEA